tara:strand:- start:128 stop:286 length:159 start_codon:yes stop_codon:yes gene_type:complete
MEILIPIHILAGIISLFSAALSVSSEKGKKLHVLPAVLITSVIFWWNFKILK